MDIFKRDLAPISDQAWQEINSRAETVINSQLTSRKSLKVLGPFGLSYTSVPTGRLDILENTTSNVKLGLYQHLSLLETRISFSLSKWELDNILRGTKDVDLSALEKAAKELALFEDDVIYNGHPLAKIVGLTHACKHKVTIALDSEAILTALSKGLVSLKKSFVEPPFNFIVGEALFDALNHLHGSRRLKAIIEEMIGGEVIFSEVVEGGLLIPVKHVDLEFTVGQEYTIGYESHDNELVTLFIMNSFTMRVLDENILLRVLVK